MVSRFIQLQPQNEVWLAWRRAYAARVGSRPWPSPSKARLCCLSNGYAQTE